MKGNLDTFRLEEILQLIASQRKDGVLRLSSSDRHATFVFEDGRILNALFLAVEESVVVGIEPDEIAEGVGFEEAEILSEVGATAEIDQIGRVGEIDRRPENNRPAVRAVVFVIGIGRDSRLVRPGERSLRSRAARITRERGDSNLISSRDQIVEQVGPTAGRGRRRDDRSVSVK